MLLVCIGRAESAYDFRCLMRRTAWHINGHMNESICFGCRHRSANSAQYEIHFISKCNRSIHSAHEHQFGFSTAEYHLNRYTNQRRWWWSQCMQTIIFFASIFRFTNCKVNFSLFVPFHIWWINARGKHTPAMTTSSFESNSKLFRNCWAIFLVCEHLSCTHLAQIPLIIRRNMVSSQKYSSVFASGSAVSHSSLF